MQNLRKQAKADPTVHYDKQLEEHREESGTGVPDEGITELQLKHNSHKDKDNTVHYEAQLEAVRADTPDCIVENCLNTEPIVYNLKRDDRTHSKPAKSQDLVAAAYDAAHDKAKAEANEGQDRDTEFWDKEVGIQMIGKPTKIVGNTQKSQLSNTPARFKDLKPDLLQKIDDSVISRLSSADKMLFHIYATAAHNGRVLNTSEEQQVKDINSGKTRLLMAAQMALKTGQWDDFNDDSIYDRMADDGRGLGDYGEFENQQAHEDMRADMEDPTTITLKDSPESGTVFVLSDGEVIDEFSTLEEAKSNYPEAETDHPEVEQPVQESPLL